MTGRSRIRLAISQYQTGRPTNAKTKMPITITQSKKAVPQRGWIKLNFCTSLGRQLGAGLERVDRLVLGAVVLEDAPQVGQQPDQPDVGDEDGDADQPLDDDEPPGVLDRQPARQRAPARP